MNKCPCLNTECPLCPAVLYEGLTPQQVCRMHGVVQKKSYDPKAVLFHEGGNANQLYLLKSGFVKLTTALPDGRNQGLRLGGAWQFIGLEAMTDQRYPYTAEAITPVEVCTVRYKDMQLLLEQNPRFSLQVITALNRELQHSNAMIRNLGLMSSTERVASFLQSLLAPDNEMPREIPLPLSRTDMAEMLGLTLETVSRVLSRMCRAEIIAVRPGGRLLRVLDPERLAELGGDSAADIWPRTATG